MFFYIKKTVDTFVVVWSLSSKDHINVILDSLAEEYDNFIILIISQLDPYNIEEFESLLLAQLKCFEKKCSNV